MNESFALERHEFSPSSLWLLVRFGAAPTRRAPVNELLRGGFGALARHARRKSALINQVAFSHVAQALSALGDNAAGPAVHDALMLAGGNGAHYELKQAGGDVALALTALGVRRARRDLSWFIEARRS